MRGWCLWHSPEGAPGEPAEPEEIPLSHDPYFLAEFERTTSVRVLMHDHQYRITRRRPLAWRYTCTLDHCEYFLETFTIGRR